MKKCVNGCDAPICPPSAVICRACMDKITATLEAAVKRLDDPPRPPLDIRQAWGACAREARHDLGLTLADVAKDLGISLTLLSEYETGTVWPGARRRAIIEEYYGV